MTMPKFDPVAYRFTAPGITKLDVWPHGGKWHRLFTEDQLTAAYEAGKRDAVPEWQPIETAPKDGTRILAYCKTHAFDLDQRTYVQSGHKVEHIWFKKGEWARWCGNMRTESTGTPDPTHWMPLPAAPSPEGASNDNAEV